MKEDIQEMNDFLKGLYMGVHAYDYYIENCEDPTVKKTLQDIQKEHKLSTIQVAERIQNLGGKPAKDEGAFASIIGKFQQITAPTNTEEIIKEAMENEQKYAVHVAGENIKGDISEQQKQLIDSIFERNAKHVETLKHLLH
ncbi:DUF2383 domain-containing protein [Bacillus sp. AGMB 02131]|uniref:DUF2383 domain-containing protein n=1 Tax=Peribacillus faecalis TaxID=2772559 RepID=A0A927CS93_9BACI|nr:DUF2383 domain-containing protein [Peribacillus faecalis]MBD3106952.1 DUF2383 domain-containing protein [Peribacillus faecalis]